MYIWCRHDTEKYGTVLKDIVRAVVPVLVHQSIYTTESEAGKTGFVRLKYFSTKYYLSKTLSFRPVLSGPESAAKISRNRTRRTPFLRLIFVDKWKAHEGDSQDWMRCAPPLPNEQSKEFQFASTNCVGIYGKRNGRDFKTKKKPGFMRPNCA